MKHTLEERADEIKLLQSKYEEKLDAKEQQLLEVKAKQMQLIDKAQFEVDFLKKELEAQLRHKE